MYAQDILHYNLHYTLWHQDRDHNYEQSQVNKSMSMDTSGSIYMENNNKQAIVIPFFVCDVHNPIL